MKKELITVDYLLNNGWEYYNVFVKDNYEIGFVDNDFVKNCFTIKIKGYYKKIKFVCELENFIKKTKNIFRDFECVVMKKNRLKNIGIDRNKFLSKSNIKRYEVSTAKSLVYMVENLDLFWLTEIKEKKIRNDEVFIFGYYK